MRRFSWPKQPILMPGRVPIRIPFRYLAPTTVILKTCAGGTQGLTQVAQAWNRSLSKTFFAQQPAYVPTGFLSTGIVPRLASPGQSFLLPYAKQGTLPDPIQVVAHLLDSGGNFLALVGSGTQSPLRVTLPASLPDADYRLRVVAQNPTLAGTASEVLRVRQGVPSPQMVRSLEARIVENSVEVYALSAPAPGTTRVTVERSDDREIFQSVGTLPVPSNPGTSHVYSFTDPNPSILKRPTTVSGWTMLMVLASTRRW